MFDRRQRVLVIDDEAALRDSIVAALDPIRFRVIVAAGVPAAATLCHRAAFDLVICSRVSTLACFRSTTRDVPEIPVLVLTRDRHRRPWTMTNGVRFATPPPGIAALRDLVVGAIC
jgi:DNA-binding NtrC family response regulator